MADSVGAASLPSLSRTLGQVLAEAKARLTVPYIDDPALEARMIVEHYSATLRSDSIIQPDMQLASDTVATIDAALSRRLAQEPVHRIFGAREFYGLRLALSPETLEPRPDTETLVDLVLPVARRFVASKGACRILDLGAGAGAIALALLGQIAEARAVATDISAGALATVGANAAALGLASRLETVESNWFDAVRGRFDVIVSNPPYIPSGEIATLQPEVRLFDPLLALDGGRDGLDAYRVIASGAIEHLSPHGRVAVEIGAGQRTDVEALFASTGFDLIEARRDLGGHERALLFAPSPREARNSAAG